MSARALEEMGDGMKWVVGVTTAPREGSTLERCLNSLVANGWQPIVFAEPGTDVSPAKRLGLRIVQWKDKKGCWGNWLTMCRELLAHHPDADVFLTVQDDTVFHPQARAFAEANGVFPAPAETVGFFSFYSARHYQNRYHVYRPNGSMVGNYPSVQTARSKAINEKKYPGRQIKEVRLKVGPAKLNTQSFWGACAMAFPRESLRKIINHRIAIEWRGFNDKQEGAEIRNSDTAIGRICNALNLGMWVWNPSLSHHVAKHSTIGHGDNSGQRNASWISKNPWEDAVPTHELRFVKHDDMELVAARLAHRLPKDVWAVCGVPRSGLPAAIAIAKNLHLPIVPIEYCLGQDIRPYRPEVSCELKERPKKGKVLIVDDSIAHGKTWKELRPLIKVPHYAAVLYCSPQGESLVDFFGQKCNTQHVFQWQWLANSWLAHWAFDFDGVLCEDWTLGPHEKHPKEYEEHLKNAAPLYLPREKIMAIITGRPESVRPQTEAWLERHGVQYGKLIMRPDDDRRCHAEIKADHYRLMPGAMVYAESCPKQAEKIHQLTRRPVFSVSRLALLGETGA